MGGPSSEELLRRYGEGEMAAFDAFYRRFERPLMAFLLARLGQRADAEEAFQETFLRVHRSIVRYDPQQSAAGWVLGIARNVAIDVLRRRRVRARVAAPEVDPDALAGRGSGPEAQAVARGQLDAMLGGLSADEAELFRARIVDDESYEEMARARGVKEEVVRQRVSRLLRRLRGAGD